MPIFEYRVVPSPSRAEKGKGQADGRFADTLALILNAEAKEGWEFLRAETLPREERQGLAGKTKVFQTVLVFRRPTIASDATETQPRLIEDKTPSSDEPAKSQEHPG